MWHDKENVCVCACVCFVGSRCCSLLQLRMWCAMRQKGSHCGKMRDSTCDPELPMFACPRKESLRLEKEEWR